MKKMFIVLSLGVMAQLAADQPYLNKNSARNLAETNETRQDWYYQNRGITQANPARNESGTASITADQALFEKVQDALKGGWFSKGYDRVTFTINDGNVTLRGAVDTLDDKKKVEQNVRDITGVKNVNNQITVAPAKSTNNNNGASTSNNRANNNSEASNNSVNKSITDRPIHTTAIKGEIQSDQAIAKEIQNSLKSGWFSKGYDKVTYAVNNGNVILRGSVETLDDKNKVEEEVRDIDGVKNVKSEIRVVPTKKNGNDSDEDNGNGKKYPQDFAATPADKKINKKIRRELSGGWFTSGYDTVVVKTTRGIVVLTGTVNSTNDLEDINERLQGIEGVKRIDNQLIIKNSR